jgi:ABC-type glycerol-3-phosphate transport system substrate-binding protein
MKTPFESGLATMTVGGSGVPKTPGLDWGATMIPQNKQVGSRVWSNLWIIPAKTKNTEAAWKVLSFFAGPEGQRVTGRVGNVPALRPIAAEMNINPYVMRAFEVGIPYPTIANRTVWDIFNANMPKLWSNEMPASAVAEEIQRQVEPLM